MAADKGATMAPDKGWTMRSKIKPRNQELPRLQIGQDVEKYKGAYGGPGKIVSKFPVGDNEWRYIVAHKIEGGFGKLLHIYGEGQLRPLETRGTDDRSSSREAPTKALRGRSR